MALIDRDELLKAFRFWDGSSNGTWDLTDIEITINEQQEIITDYDSGYKKGREEGKKILASVEYDLSAKCNKLSDENLILSEKYECIQDEYKALQAELARVRAQMDIVYLIFGGKQ